LFEQEVIQAIQPPPGKGNTATAWCSCDNGALGWGVSWCHW